jgi:hypothetical protein
LRGLLGEGAPLSAPSIARLKAGWQAEYELWKARSVAELEVVYLWVDGVYVKAGLEKDKAAMLVVLAALRTGQKVILAVGLLGLLVVLMVATEVSAQAPRRIARVGILNYAAAQDARVSEFRDGLRELGYVEGQNLAITYRWADGRLDRLAELAAELVRSNVDVIIAIGPAVWAAKRTTRTVPIVIAFSGDPVGNGVVSNLRAARRKHHRLLVYVD